MRRTNAPFDHTGDFQPLQAFTERATSSGRRHETSNRLASFGDDPLSAELDVA
jgi:hypothetical protein